MKFNICYTKDGNGMSCENIDVRDLDIAASRAFNRCMRFDYDSARIDWDDNGDETRPMYFEINLNGPYHLHEYV